jgi:Flp pilus assembly pilin Flp
MLSRYEPVFRRLIVWASSWRGAARGQGLVEYAAILVFVAAVLVVAELYLQPHIAASLNNVANSF